MTLCLYNEHDAFAAAWLRELIADGELPIGDVDERDIEALAPEDCGDTFHAFAGIGGWPYALRLAGWPDDRPVWTGSCPCQPFSSAGRGQAVDDERHLWPAFRRLIAERRPPTIFGEQVASKLGRRWLAGVRADLEELGYAVGAADLPAACVGAPHIRQRLFWVAYADRQRRRRWAQGSRREARSDATRDGLWMGDPDRAREVKERRVSQRPGAECERSAIGLGNADTERRARLGLHVRPGRPLEDSIETPWSSSRLIECIDGKTRRIPESGILPLAHGVPNRVGTLRGAGNAINPQAAAIFIRAVMDGA